MIRGVLKADGVAIFEGSFSFIAGAGASLSGKAAFVGTSTGDTFGWTTCAVWSPDTIAKLQELRACMEVDLGHVYLENGGESLTQDALGPRPTPGNTDGIGEHVGSV